jgi:hypothetical protein
MEKTIITQEDDHIEIILNNVLMVIKHNDIGISVDYYNNKEIIEKKENPQPFKEDDIWWEDAE